MPSLPEKDDTRGPWNADLNQGEWRYRNLVDERGRDGKPKNQPEEKQNVGSVIDGKQNIWV